MFFEIEEARFKFQAMQVYVADCIETTLRQYVSRLNMSAKALRIPLELLLTLRTREVQHLRMIGVKTINMHVGKHIRCTAAVK